jgi:hypothetical protein
MSRLRALSLGACVSALLLSAAACAPAVITPDSTTVTLEPREARVPAPSPPEDPRPNVIWPLTGADAGNAEAAEQSRPAIAVKIENSSDARPQTNLYRADVVYEQYVEYGISRLVAVYHSDYPEEVGPIRSMRPMDPHIAGPYDGPLAFSGAQRRFINAAAATGQDLVAQDIGSYGFFRTNTKPAPHNLFGRLTDFQEQADNPGPPDIQWDFAYPSEFATAQRMGEQISTVDIRMSARAQPAWQWDEGDRVWLRTDTGAPHVDTNGTQISATNIVMLWVDVIYTSRSGGSSVPETMLTDRSNGGYVVSGDRIIEVEWSKGDRTDSIEITTTDGAPVQLMPGQTWVELVPQSGVADSTSIDFE